VILEVNLLSVGLEAEASTPDVTTSQTGKPKSLNAKEASTLPIKLMA
jgi:hypothetical protein